MTVQAQPVIYKTTDGREYTDKEQAERHEALTAVKTAYEDARRNYAAALAESHKTADGYQFKLTGMRDYYFVTPGWYGAPEIKKVAFYIWNCDLSDNDEAAIVDTSEGRRIEYKISALYRQKANAKKALIRTWGGWLAGLEDEYEKMLLKMDAD